MQSSDKTILQLASYAGKLLIEAEAEGYRVERTVKQILEVANVSYLDVYSSASGLFINLEESIDDQQSDTTTLVVRVQNRSNQIFKIDRVNAVTYDFIDQRINAEEALRQLKAIPETEFTAHNNFVSIFILIMAYIALFDGQPGDLVISLIPSILILFFLLSDDNFGMNSFLINVFMTASLSFVLPLIAYYVTDNFNPNIVISATLMPLYPGTAFTNGIRDAIRGDYSTALTRFIDALLTALSLALGVALGLVLSNGVITLWN